LTDATNNEASVSKNQYDEYLPRKIYKHRYVAGIPAA
jgi:hypothetical protein